MSGTIRVYVNGRGVDVESGSSLLDAVRAFDESVAAAVTAGDRALTDSRGLPVTSESPAFTGAIVRVVSGKRTRADEGA